MRNRAKTLSNNNNTNQGASSEDLRSFLAAIEEKGAGTYQVIGKPVSPKWATTAIVQGLAAKLRSPVIRFEQVEGCDYPMVTNVCASIDRVAKSVGLTMADLNDRFVAAMDTTVDPIIVEQGSAPVQEHQKSFESFSLKQLPALVYTDTQVHPYITSSIVVARDPDTGAHNLSFHRLMIGGDDIAAIYMTPGGHLDRIWQKNRSAGRATPVAAVIGTHPLWCYASLVAGPLKHDDYGVTGAVLNEPLALARCIDDPELLVPARAEMVLEGRIEASETESEGPFGEFLGFVADAGDRPVVRFTTMTSREQPIYQDIVAGQIEHMTMSSVSLRARLHRDYFRDEPAVTDFWLPAAMTIFIAVDREAGAGFDANALMQRLLDNESYIKQVYCFDSDVDLRKLASVQTAIACFVQGDRDIKVFSDRSGNGVDPSEIDGRTSKVAVDARAKRAATKSQLPEDFLETFDLMEWLGD